MMYELIDFPTPPIDDMWSGDVAFDNKDYANVEYMVPHQFQYGTKSLFSWLYSAITSDPRVIVTTMIIHGSKEFPSMGRHIDELNRQFTLNYIVDQGGEAPTTTFYKGSSALSHVCEVGKWYLLETSIPHSVEGLSRDRKMVVINSKPSCWTEQQDILTKLLTGRKLKKLL
jgi:hypothetical protein